MSRRWRATLHLRKGQQAGDMTATAVAFAPSHAIARRMIERHVRGAGHVLIWMSDMTALGDAEPDDLAGRATPSVPVILGSLSPMIRDGAEREAKAEERPVTWEACTWDTLLADTAPPLWAVLDGVNCPDAQARVAGAEAACLYTTQDPAARAMAPWLVRLEADSEQTAWLRALSQERHWGILFQSTATLKALRAHFRKFTMLWTPANAQAPVYFRFYDPRVAVDAAQVLHPDKIERLMGPCSALVAPLSSLAIPPEAPPFPAVDLETARSTYPTMLAAIRSAAPTDADNGRAFRIDHTEYSAFGACQKRRVTRQIALQLSERHTDRSVEECLNAVGAAVRIGAEFGLHSVKETVTLATCELLFGPGFPRDFPEAGAILSQTALPAWRRRSLLDEWMPKERLRRERKAMVTDPAPDPKPLHEAKG